MTNKKIKEFLDQIKQKLPEWITENKDELNDVLDEIENHLYDKASEISKNEDPDDYAIELAIQKMGSPSDIAKEYKKRGTPKFYITEELSPLYYKSLGFSAAITGTLMMIWLILSLTVINSELSVFSIIMRSIRDFIIYLSLSVIIVTAIFVYLSMQGFLPEDFEEFIEMEKNKKKQKGKRAEIQIALATTLDKVNKKKDTFYKPGEWVPSAIFLFIIGSIMVFQPFSVFQTYLGYKLQIWILLNGVLIYVQAALFLNHLFQPKASIGAHQFIKLAFVIVQVLDLILFVQLMIDPLIVEIMIDGEAQLLAGDIISTKLYYWIAGLITLAKVIDIATKSYQVVIFKEKYVVIEEKLYY